MRTPLRSWGQDFPVSEKKLALHTCCLDCTWVLVMRGSDLGNSAPRHYDDYCNLLRLLMLPLPRLRVLWYAPHFWKSGNQSSYMNVEGCGRCGWSRPFCISLPCGNRKFTGLMPDGKIELYLGRSILGRSIWGRTESNKGVVCPLPCPQDSAEINAEIWNITLRLRITQTDWYVGKRLRYA